MLPNGFNWRDDDDGQTLFVGTKQVAYWTLVPNGRVRVCTHSAYPMDMKFRFFATAAAAHRFVEAWATKWEIELQERYGRP